jgi:hypothetical protein
MSNAQKLSQFISNAVSNTSVQETYTTGSGSNAFINNQHKNYIINGNFDIWQRNTTQTGNGYGSDDRWINNIAGSTQTVSRQAFTVGQTAVANNPTYFSRTVVTSVAGTANDVRKVQRIEYATRVLSGKTVTLSFYAKADATKNIATEYAQVFGTGGSPSATVTSIGVTTFTLTTSWQKFSVTTTLPSISGKTFGTNNNDELELSFWFDAGSTFNTRTNSLGQQSGTFDISQVQLEEGSVVTNFEIRLPSTELTLCQRYYEKSFPLGTVPAQNATAVGSYFFPQVVGASASQNGGTIRFAVTKRDAPTVTFFNPSAANAQARNTSIVVDCSATTVFTTVSDTCINPTVTTPAGSAAGQSLAVHWTADAEI